MDIWLYNDVRKSLFATMYEAGMHRYGARRNGVVRIGRWLSRLYEIGLHGGALAEQDQAE